MYSVAFPPVPIPKGPAAPSGTPGNSMTNKQEFSDHCKISLHPWFNVTLTFKGNKTRTF